MADLPTMSTLQTFRNYGKNRLESENQTYFYLNVSIEVEFSAREFFILINIFDQSISKRKV